ncbi:hypothetical protein GCM10009127_05350 [Alteraurantiacibacter aestuarii]|uniref:DUF8021 domain-containing protein n=1 Tax=Alteraurantiacibacter aestuarii TaxID=650004 RepID=A0A844ZMY7_9SPHN|nr:hypothetical protein [Alteraurantiacibacter aestuarii]MXO88217.1 hypothetical protein [Alteraurantiacibacter aestuarii]
MKSESEWGSRPSKLARGTIKCSIILAGMTAATNAQAACERGMLRQLAATYVEAQSTGQPAIVPLAAESYYGENNLPVDIAAGILTQALPVDFTRSFYDTEQCATFTELVSATNAHPYVIHTRMEVSDGEVTVMESVVTDEGDWVFGADAHLAQTQVENWGEIPAGQRDTRESIQAAADAYLDNWGNPELPVPHGTPCARLEGRIYTGSRDPEGQTCTMGAFPQPIETGSRRYVIDETVGAVSIFHNFSWIDAGLGPYHPGTPTSQTFRVEGGMNRYIHEVTACTTPKCGR